MFDIPGYKAAGPAEAPEVKDNNPPKTNYLTVDPDSENNVRRVWPVGEPQAMATASPTARAVGAMAADAGKWTPNPSTVAEDEVLQYSTPTASRDAQGKTLPQYRMGIGHRILGTLANFANGFARNGAQPIYVGPGALNNRYYQDEQERQQNLAGAKQRLQTLWNEPVKDPPLETTNPGDMPPELNKNIPPVGPAMQQPAYNAFLRPAAMSPAQTASTGLPSRNAASRSVRGTVSQRASVPATTLGRTEAEHYLSLARGNKDLARKLARLDGHIV